jgi:hypothetical protein
MALGFATVASLFAITNAFAIRDNCRRIALHTQRTRSVFEESLKELDRGELDDDYRRFFGSEAQARKKEQRERLVHQIEIFAPTDCTITIVRWLKGD